MEVQSVYESMGMDGRIRHSLWQWHDLRVLRVLRHARRPVAQQHAARTVAAFKLDRQHGNLWLFGGLQGYDHSQRNDMWELQPSSNLWTWMGGASSEGQSGNYGTLRVLSGNSVPGGRQGATSWTGKDGTLWLFGGDGYDANGLNGYLNDLWAFTLPRGSGLGWPEIPQFLMWDMQEPETRACTAR